MEGSSFKQYASIAVPIVAVLAVIFIAKYVKPKPKKTETKSIEVAKDEASVCCNTDEGCGEDSCDCKSPATKKPKRKKTGRRIVGILPKPKNIRIVYGTQTGTAKEWAERISEEAFSRGYNVVDVQDMTTYDIDEYLHNEQMIIFVVSTYTDGTPPEKCVPFFEWLDAHSLDFRVDKENYARVLYTVFGIGNSVYSKNYNAAARRLDRIMHKLSCRRVVPVGSGDNGAGVEVIEGFTKWSNQLWENLDRIDKPIPKPEPGTPLKEALLPKSEKRAPKTETSEEPDEDPLDEQQGEPLVDLEDLGDMLKGNTSKGKKEVKKVSQDILEDLIQEEDDEEEEESSEEDEDEAKPGEVKEMLTPSLRKALTKQGYKLLGTHSGVKMCRWTKAMLRGRGGCYKHTFYGIKSYQCMEMTPSLACANKCVFCWRHHKNPVGTEWKWKVDDPDELFEAAINNHRQLIKQMKGVPGVIPERYEEAFTIKHCALSLVGEPITYPYINRFVDLLHSKQISSFMVTNAQFPDKIDELKPVTQLYISVDAATKESLKKIDRPLFEDFWERFLASIDSLSKKGQRTVFRLTLVKDWNMEEVKNYADLIKRGNPSFVEVKGVTYCGTSKASTLTMKQVPFHEEVVKFTQALCDAIGSENEYELAAEHEHSCCILMAHKSFKKEGVWHTWIDYPKFHELVESGKPFDALDYTEPTPNWALFRAKERGFDPDETRFRRNKAYQTSGC